MNQANGYRSTVLCGAFNLSFGQYSVSCGLSNDADGNNSYTFGLYTVGRATNGKFAYSGGEFSTPGDVQMGWVQLRTATATTAATRLTSDAAAPSINNVVNMNTAGLVYHLRVSATCRDTTNGDWAVWAVGDGVMNRPATGNVTYAGVYTTATTPSMSAGAGSTATLTLAADTTNNGLSASVAMPNTHLWHCVLKADTPEEIE